MWWVTLTFAGEPETREAPAPAAEPFVDGPDRIADPGRWLEHERRRRVKEWWQAQSEASEVWFSENTDPEPVLDWLAALRKRERPLYLADVLDGTRLWRGLGEWLPAPHKDGNAGPGPRFSTVAVVERDGVRIPVPHDPYREVCAMRLITSALVLVGERTPYRPLAPHVERPCDLVAWDVDSGKSTPVGTFSVRGLTPTRDGGALLLAHGSGKRTTLTKVDLKTKEHEDLYRGRRGLTPSFLADDTFVGVSEHRNQRAVGLRLMVGPLDDLRWLPRYGDAQYCGGHDGELLLRTERYGAGGNLVRVDPEQPRRPAWRVLVGERPGMDLLYGRVHGETLVTAWARDGLVQVEEAPYEGGPGRVVDTHGPVTNAWLWHTNQEQAVLGVSTPTASRWYARDPSGTLTEIGEAADLAGTFFSVEVTSADGTKVPVSLVSPPGDPPLEGRPVLLYVYGGFEQSQTLRIGPVEQAFLAAGGTVGVVHARGGRERGDAWHDEAVKVNHVRTYEDLIAAARGLVDLGIAAPGKVAVTGGSNGGLTVAAAVARDPETFGAAIPISGVYDLLRARKFGRWWPDEYGRMRKEDESAVLRAESPVYRIPAGPLPPIWVRTGERDPVVAPAHSYKLTSAWQGYPGGPVLLSVDPWGSHGGRTTVDKSLRQVTRRDPTSLSDARTAQTVAFLFAVFDMALPAEGS